MPFLDAHGDVDQAVELLRQRGQFVKVRREQRAAAIGLVQVLDRRPGDRQAVEGRGAAADLVEDDERALARLVEDRRGLDHLDHEGRAPAREIVGGADAREQPVDDRRSWRGAPARSCPSAPARRSARSGADRSTCPPCSGRSRHRCGRHCRPPAATDRNRWRRTASRSAPARPPDGGRLRLRNPGCDRPRAGHNCARPRAPRARTRHRARRAPARPS